MCPPVLTAQDPFKAHTETHLTNSLVIYLIAVCKCYYLSLFFPFCPDPVIIIQRWRWRADGGDEPICSEESRRSFPQVKQLTERLKVTPTRKRLRECVNVCTAWRVEGVRASCWEHYCYESRKENKKEERSSAFSAGMCAFKVRFLVRDRKQTVNCIPNCYSVSYTMMLGCGVSHNCT